VATYTEATPLSLAHLSELEVAPAALVDIAARAGFASIGLRTAPAVSANVMRSSGSGQLGIEFPEAGIMVAVDGQPSGRLVFMEFERRREAMAQTPARARGLCRLRYDTTNLHATLERVPGGGGSLVRGPASVDDPILGQGLVALVRAPFGVLIELWQTS